MSSDLYAPPQHVVPSHAAWEASEGILSPLGGRSMQHPANELRRILLPRTPVNKYDRDSSPVHYHHYNVIVTMWGNDVKTRRVLT